MGSALSGVFFCLDFSPFLFLLLFPCHVFFISLFIYDKLDENLPNIHKTKHPKKKGERKVQDGWIQVQAKRRNHQPGWIARGTRSNQVLNLP